MKIVRKGPMPKWWVGKHIACYGCKSDLQFEADDKVREVNDVMTLYAETVCPVCSATIRLPHRDY